MPKQLMPIVNASTLLPDDQVANVVEALQLQYDQDFKPAWRDLVPDMEFSFVPMSGIANLNPAGWPQFLNRHSQDPGALGWHTQEGKKIYGRIFVGDCLAFGISWPTDLGHEALETALDPLATKVWRMPDGTLAAFEDADAVEADKFSYTKRLPSGLVIPCTNFVRPEYFSVIRTPGTKYDFQGILKGPCPDLSEGGYMSLLKPGASEYSMVQANHANGVPGRRFLQLYRHRRIMRHESLDDLEEVDLTALF